MTLVLVRDEPASAPAVVESAPAKPTSRPRRGRVRHGSCVLRAPDGQSLLVCWGSYTRRHSRRDTQWDRLPTLPAGGRLGWFDIRRADANRDGLGELLVYDEADVIAAAPLIVTLEQATVDGTPVLGAKAWLNHLYEALDAAATQRRRALLRLDDGGADASPAA